jgi:hypothetical protein
MVNKANITGTIIHRFRMHAFSHCADNSANYTITGMTLQVNGALLAFLPYSMYDAAHAAASA